MADNVARVVRFVHLFLFALVVGVLWGTWFSLSRSIAAITPPTFLEVGHTMIANLGGPMAVLFPATLLSALPVLVSLYRRQRRGFYLMLVGVGLLVVALVITLTVNVEPAAPASVTNTVTISGGGDANSSNNSARSFGRIYLSSAPKHRLTATVRRKSRFASNPSALR